MKEYVPRGYKIEDVFDADGNKIDEKLINEETGEWFYLKNREFKDIDHNFAGNISKAIKEKLKTTGENELVWILDIGGGIEAKSAVDIADKYSSKKSRVKVVSTDITARPNQGGKAHQVVSDFITQFPFRDEAIDISYSRQSVIHLIESNPELLPQILTEIGRVLKPGGIFFVDINWLYAVEGKSEISEKLGKLPVSFFSEDMGLFVGSIERLRLRLENYPRPQFLIMIKNPVNEGLLKKLGLKDKKPLR